MATTSFACTNPRCLQPLAFDQALVGSIQQCPHCGQRLIVPEAPQTQTSELINPAPVMRDAASQPYEQALGPATSYTPHTGYRQVSQEQERVLEVQSARKLNMGSGCLAMLAVMFALAIMGYGIGTILRAAPDQSMAWSALIAGPAGVIAFVFFGYIATETASTSKDKEKR